MSKTFRQAIEHLQCDVCGAKNCEYRQHEMFCEANIIETDHIVAAHAAVLEHIAAGMKIDRVARETMSTARQLKADQAHVRKESKGE